MILACDSSLWKGDCGTERGEPHFRVQGNGDLWDADWREEILWEMETWKVDTWGWGSGGGWGRNRGFRVGRAEQPMGDDGLEQSHLLERHQVTVQDGGQVRWSRINKTKLDLKWNLTLACRQQLGYLVNLWPCLVLALRVASACCHLKNPQITLLKWGRCPKKVYSFPYNKTL